MLVDQITFPGGTGINLRSTSRSGARPAYNYPHPLKLLPQPPPLTIPESERFSNPAFFFQ